MDFDRPEMFVLFLIFVPILIPLACGAVWYSVVWIGRRIWRWADGQS